MFGERIKVEDISAEAFRIAADWWFDRIVGKDQYKDNGCSEFHSVFAGVLGEKTAHMNPVDDTGDKRQSWYDALKKHAAVQLDGYGEVYLKVDYDPNRLLHDMLEETGIDRSRLPIKTNMTIGFDDRGDGIWLSAGYGAESVYMCDLSGKVPEKRTVVKYLYVSPEFKGHDGTVFPERRHESEFHAYSEEYLNKFLNRDDYWDSESTHADGHRNSYKIFVSKTEQTITDGQWG